MSKPNGYWTKERVVVEAVQYSTRTEFMKGSNGAYTKARRKGWMDEVCSHMTSPQKPSGYWHRDKSNVAKEALMYNTRAEFQRGSTGAYKAAWQNDWMDEVCAHMDVVGSIVKRAIYAMLFSDPDNSAYVGLSWNPENRLMKHFENSSNKHVRDLIARYGLPTPVIFDGWFTIEEAGLAEQEVLDVLEGSGHAILNISKTGALGGTTIKWTKETIIEEALKHTTRADFINSAGRAYWVACKNNWIDEVCSHMIVNKHSNQHWTKELCLEVAKDYETKGAFMNGLPGAYDAAYKHGWLDEACSHMEVKKLKNGHWTKDACIAEVARFSTRCGFRKGSPSAYSIAASKGWLKELCAHFGDGQKPRGFWNIKSNVTTEALKYSSRGEFQKRSQTVYKAARLNGWMDEVCAHMA